MLEAAGIGATALVAIVAIGAQHELSRRAESGPVNSTCSCRCEVPPSTLSSSLCHPVLLVVLGFGLALLNFVTGVLCGACCPRAAVRHRVEGPVVPRGKGQYYQPALTGA